MSEFPAVDHEQLYAVLEKEILHFVRKPGEPVSENTLCERFGLSRTPVRSLLQRLQQNGLVQIFPRRGSLVTRLNLDTINQLIYERMAVETMVMRDYTTICSPTDLTRIRFLYSQMARVAEAYPGEDFSQDEFMSADLAMHGEWFHRQNLSFLWSHLSRPNSSYTRFCMLDLQEGSSVPDVLAEHREMLRLIESGSVHEIEPLLRKHLYGGVRRLGSRIYTDFAAYFEPFDGEIGMS